MSGRFHSEPGNQTLVHLPTMTATNYENLVNRMFFQWEIREKTVSIFPEIASSPSIPTFKPPRAPYYAEKLDVLNFRKV